MTKENVIFKLDGKEIVAFLVDDQWQDGKGNTLVTCYSRIGQHSGASPDYMNALKEANKHQYSKLLKELNEIGYELNILNRN